MIHRLDLAHHFNRSTSLATRQLAWSAIGVACAIAVIVYVRDHRSLARYTYTAMVVGFGAAPAPAAARARPGHPRRPDLDRASGRFSFQPGEIAKICLALFFAGYLVTAARLALAGRAQVRRPAAAPRARPRADPRRLGWPASACWSWSSDLGTSLLFFGLFVAMLYVATERDQLDRHRPAALRRRRRTRRTCCSATCRSGSTSGCTPSPHQRPSALPAGPGPVRHGQRRDCSAPAWARAARTDRRSRRATSSSPAFGEELGLAGLFALLVLYGCSSSAACAPPSASATVSASCSPPAWRSRLRCRSSSSSAASPGSSR